MATTYFDYDGDGSETLFAITFDYLEDEHVTVELDGVATTAFTINTVQPTKRVEMNTPPGNGVNVRIRRKSQPDTNLVDFVNGSVLTESELDRAYLHNRYLAEEISELNDQSLQVEAGGTQWDAKSLRIKNVGTPTLTTDASTKDYVDSKVNQVSSGASSPPTKWVFTGTAGANTTYSVTGAEVNGDTAYDVSIDGAVKEPTTDYTVDPDTDTLTIVPTLSGGEDIVVIERGFGIAITTGTISGSQIQDSAITNSKLGADAVDGSKIADDSVDSEHYVDGSIDSVHLAADVVDGSKIADDSIDSEHYVDGSIDEAHIADEAVTSDKISTTDSVFNVQSNGNVGIGATPAASIKLQVAGDILASASNILVTNGGAASGVGLYSPAANEMGLSTNSTEHIRIDSDGKVGIGTTTPNSAAKLDVSSTTGGILFPRLTNAERDLLTPTAGLVIYNTTGSRLQVYSGGQWVNLHSV